MKLAARPSRLSHGSHLAALLVALTSVVGCGADGVTSATQWAEPGICIVTQFTANQTPFARIAVDSQQRYAKRHGYTHRYYVGRPSGDDFVDPDRGDRADLYGGGLYWQKVAATAEMLAAGGPAAGPVAADAPDAARHCHWVVWFDSDIVISNPAQTLDSVIATYTDAATGPAGADVDVIVSAEEVGAVPINSGAFFVRNTAIGRDFVTSVGALYPAYRNRGLPDQDAVTDVALRRAPWPAADRATGLAPAAGTLHPRAAMAPQRHFNAFARPTANDPPAGRWHPCDFVAHVASAAPRLRAAKMAEILATVSGCEQAGP